MAKKTFLGSKSTNTCSAPKLTLACITPLRPEIFFSIREAQLEQVIPRTEITTDLKSDIFFCSVAIRILRSLR